MGDIAREYLQVRVLKTLEPLSSLGADKLEELANKSQVEELPPGRLVFRQGEKDKRTIYLLSGTLELQITGNPNAEQVKAKTLEAKYPIAQELPRPSTCRTKTNAVLLYIDSDLLEFLMDDSPSGSYEVTEINVDEDPESGWMLRFLQSPAFLRLPTEKIQSLLVKLDEYPVRKGQIVIKQGDNDPWYYIVKQGQCVVSRRPAPTAEDIRLAILGPGDGFGEEALITQGKRNATVTMKDNGVLMRLSKRDFTELLVNPLLRYVEHHDMTEKIKSGAAVIDVRTNKEFSDNGIKGSQNIPLSMLRLKASTLNPTREHILYCNDSHQSAAAAFLLSQHGIDCYILKGGLQAQDKPFAVQSEPATHIAQPAAAPTIAFEPPSLSVTPALQTAPANKPLPRPANPPTLTSTGEFQVHRRQAKTQAERANEAELLHRNAQVQSQKLRSEADALRSQAERLASRTAAAEAERKKAEAEIQRLQDEAAKKREEMLATAKLAIAKEKERAQQEAQRLKQEAEQARRHAEEELQRIRKESEEVLQRQSTLAQTLKLAEEQKQKAARAAEDARRRAALEAERVKNEAELIRQKALDDAKRLRESIEVQRVKAQAEELAKRNAALEDARRRAEEAIRHAALAADDARRQAQLEAEAIRRAAIEEAERLRAQTNRERQTMLRQQNEEKARNELLLQQTRQRALEEAQAQAERQAKAIRQEALQDAERLRAEIEATRQLIENENLLAQHRYEEEQVYLAQTRAEAEAEAEAQAAAIAEAEAEALVQAEAEQAAAEAARRALEEARRRREQERRQDEAAARRRQEEQRILDEAAARRRQEEQHRLEEARRRQEAEQRAQEEARKLAELARLASREEEAQRRAIEETRHSEELARQRAETLKDRIKPQEIVRHHVDEFLMETGQGMKLATAKLHVVKDKTVLEGEQDIFIFKAPSQRPPSREEAEALIKQVEHQMREQSRKELPSFDLDYADKNAPSPASIEDKSDFSDSILANLGQLTAYQAPSHHDTRHGKDEFEFVPPPPNEKTSRRRTPQHGRRHLYTLAASIVIMITVSVIAITRPSYVDVNMISNGPDSSPAPEQRGLASMRSTPAAVTSSGETPIKNEVADKIEREAQVRNQAEEEFQRLLAKWRSEQSAVSTSKPAAVLP